jgi:protein O-mannosyl-transferase
MRRPFVILLLIALSVWATFGRACTFQFLSWDDELLITTNPHIAQPTIANLQWHWAHPHVNLYVPVVYSAWWTLARINSGVLDPANFHIANVLLHVLNSFLVFFILKLLLKTDWPAAAGALFFALHPLQVEPVAWACGMKDTLSAFFALSALWLFFLSATRPRAAIFYSLATLLFVLALLSKPSTVALPLIAAAVDWLLLGRSWKRIAIWTSPWLILAIAIAIVAAIVQPATEVNSGPLYDRPFIAADTLSFYTYKLLWPANLAMDYGRTPSAVLDMHLLGIPWIALVWIIPLAAAVIIVIPRCRLFVASAAIFVLALLPVLGLWKFSFQLYSTVADRYLYLAMLGPALAIGRLTKGALNRPTLAAVILAALAVRSFAQLGYWRDSVSLYRHAINVNPDSLLAHNNLGVQLAHAGDVVGAIEQYEQVIRLNPDSPADYRYVADFKSFLGDPKTGAQYAHRLLALQPNLPPDQRGDPVELHTWTANLDLEWANSAKSRGNMEDAETARDQAITNASDALKLDPTNSQAQKILAAASEIQNPKSKI